MKTIKSHTDLQQSKKLSEILPLESADMWWTALNWQETEYYVEVKQDGINQPKKAISCWSLAALLGVLPEYNLQRTDWGNKTEYKVVVTVNEDNYASSNYDNPLDACYELILKLNKLNLL